MYYVLYRDAGGYWRWTLFAANHKKISDSGEGYHNEADCQHGLDLNKASYSAPVHKR
jgi:uncharacterized protein